MGKKDFFTTYPMTKTKNLLDKQGWELDKYDGVISVQGKNTTRRGGAVTMMIREVVNSIGIWNNFLTFGYHTAKSYNFSYPGCLPKTKTFEEWFDVIEEIAMTAAEERGLEYVMASSNERKDKKFLESRGYVYIAPFFFKKVETVNSISVGNDIDKIKAMMER